MLEMCFEYTQFISTLFKQFCLEVLKMLENHSKALKCTFILLFLQDLALLQPLWGLNPRMGPECLALREIS